MDVFIHAIAFFLLSSASANFFCRISGEIKLRDDLPANNVLPPLLPAASEVAVIDVEVDDDAVAGNDDDDDDDDDGLLELLVVLVELDLLLPNRAALFCVKLICLLVIIRKSMIAITEVND